MKINPNIPVLSICIPTYNRKALLKEILDELILYPYNDIEIIIIDNASTDGTSELLKGYNDLRLKVRHNDENIGMTENQLLAFFSGNGKYTLTLMDRDKLDSKRLIDITKRLYQLDAPLILLDYTAEKETSVYGGMALSAVILRTHPSYLIYHTKRLHKRVKIDELYKMVLSDVQLPYAYTGVVGMQMLAGHPYTEIIPNRNAVVLEVKKVPSYAQYGIQHKTIYYEPEAALKRYRKYIEILIEEFPVKYANKYMPYIYTAEFYRGVLGHYQNSHGRYMSQKYKIRKKTLIEYNKFYVFFLNQAVILMIKNRKLKLKNLFVINIVSWCFLFKIYCAEKPFRKCEKLIKKANGLLDKWLYTVA